MVRDALARLMDSIRDAAMRRAFHRTRWAVGGMPVAVSFVPKAQRREYAEKVASALGIISRFDPVRRARLQRDLTGILVWPFVVPGAAAQYISGYDVCALDAAFVRDRQALFIALTIVHEATHARLRRFDYVIHAARLERLCTEAELTFAMRLPNAELIQEYVRQSLERVQEIDHSKRGQLELGLAELRESGVSRPVIAVLGWLVAKLYPRSESAPAA